MNPNSYMYSACLFVSNDWTDRKVAKVVIYDHAWVNDRANNFPGLCDRKVLKAKVADIFLIFSFSWFFLKLVDFSPKLVDSC